jgi:hypothetical protein
MEVFDMNENLIIFIKERLTILEELKGQYAECGNDEGVKNITIRITELELLISLNDKKAFQ